MQCYPTPNPTLTWKWKWKGTAARSADCLNGIPSLEVPVAAALVLFEAELSYKIGIAFMLKVN